jgi:hypothetical protein
MEQGGHRIAPLARAATFTGLRKIEDLREVPVEDKAGVSVGPNNENNDK